MTRTKALLHLARSTSKLSTGELCNFVPSRLLSNSQASTSAASDNSRADGPAGGRRGSRQSDASTRRTATGGQRDRRPESRGTSRSPTDAPRSSPGSFSAGPSRPTGERRSFNPVNDSEDRSEPEIGFVLDGQYPYAASEVEVVNVAGSTETTWEFLGSVDDQGVTWFGMDFTRGTLPEVERNALLSNEAKEMMYQMHKHDSKRYSVTELASLFQIRQQRVMAILTLKGMEHGQLAINPGKPNAATHSPSASADAPTDAEPAEPSGESSHQSEAQSAADGTAQEADPDADKPLDLRAQAVKAAMDEAAKDVPQYLKRIARQSADWQFESQAGTQQEQATDSNILMAWLKSMVKDPFWVRPGKDEKDVEEVMPDYSQMADAQDAKTMAKADQEIEQQFLQDMHQEKQRNRGVDSDPVDPNDPKEEGIERYLLSDPDNLSYIMEHELWDCHESQGTGERHVKFIPRYPKFEFFKDDRPEALKADKEAAGGQANIDRPVVSFWEHANQLQAQQEEVHLVQEFRERLNFNLQQTGASINRASRSRALPSRPEKGWSMVVQDVSDTNSKKRYVALPGGKTRKLTADEEVYLEMMQPKRRKKII